MLPAPAPSRLGRLASSLAALVTSDHHAQPHEVPEHLPVAPVLLAQADIWFLFAVYFAAVVWPMADAKTRPPPVYAYYAHSDVVGLVITAFFLALTQASFVLASATDPGRVPKEWPWDPSKPEPADREATMRDADSDSLLLLPGTAEFRGLERKMDGRFRFCKQCNVYKPDRTHHCRKLGRCVLEMDHWCAWVRNTIGLRNKKYFFLLIVYASVTLLCFLVTLGPYFVACFAQSANALNVFIVIAYVLGVVQFAALGSFTCFHAYLAATAFTTIEFREKRGAGDDKVTAVGVAVHDIYQVSPYDQGVHANMAHMLGPHVLLWGVPTRLHLPDGVVAYRVQKDHPLAKVAKAL